jgi:hypothetical protein
MAYAAVSPQQTYFTKQVMTIVSWSHPTFHDMAQTSTGILKYGTHKYILESRVMCEWEPWCNLSSETFHLRVSKQTGPFARPYCTCAPTHATHNALHSMTSSQRCCYRFPFSQLLWPVDIATTNLHREKKVKLSLSEPWRYMGGVEVRFQLFLTSTLLTDDQLQIPAALPLEKNEGIYWSGSYVGPSDCLDGFGEKKIFVPAGIWTLEFLARS